MKSTTYRLHPYMMEGQTNDEADVPDLVEKLCELLIDEMRDDGYIPMLDLTPRIFNDYNSGTHEVKVTLYGAYVGKRRSREYEGISSWKMFKKPSTRVSRSRG